MAGWRYIAERVLTGELLDLDVPFVADAPPQRELSGPGNLTGYVPFLETPTIADDGVPIIDEWSTGLYAEYNGRILWGGLVSDAQPVGDRLQISCTGFVGYPSGQPFMSVTGGAYIDYFDAVRTIWAHLQSYPTGNLHLQLDTHKAGATVGTTGEPWGLVWWDAQECGAEIDNLARTAPFDFLEEHRWNGDRTGIDHYLHLGYPRLGGRRDDLTFSPAVNVQGPLQQAAPTDAYANEIVGVGKGTGSVSARASVPSTTDTLRVRRARVITDKGLDQTPLTALCRRELARTLGRTQVPNITVHDHPDAPLGSWSIGDDILIDTSDAPWADEPAIWHRVISDQIDIGAGIAVLNLLRSDSFAY